MDEQAKELAARSTGSRYVELDALRGLAAFTVVVYHLSRAYEYKPRWFLKPMVAGTQAVILFFVLSGFVLSLPFWNKGANGNYGRYIIRRFFRIYVPYVAAVVVAALGAWKLLYSRLPLSPWFYMTWQTAITTKLLGRELLMDTTPALNTAFWSLRYEVLVSIAFPALLVGMRWLKPRVAFPLVLIASVGAGVERARLRTPVGVVELAHYGLFIVAGALLAAERQRLHEIWRRMTGVVRAAFLGASAFCYFGYAASVGKRIHLRVPEDLSCAIGAGGLILCSMHSRRLRGILLHRIPEYLGRISYSMYLVHGTVLFATLNLLYGKTSIGVMAGVYLVMTFAAAHLFCIAIEEPSLRLGKTLSMKAGRMHGRDK